MCPRVSASQQSPKGKLTFVCAPSYARLWCWQLDCFPIGTREPIMQMASRFVPPGCCEGTHTRLWCVLAVGCKPEKHLCKQGQGRSTSYLPVCCARARAQLSKSSTVSGQKKGILSVVRSGIEGGKVQEKPAYAYGQHVCLIAEASVGIQNKVRSILLSRRAARRQ